MYCRNGSVHARIALQRGLSGVLGPSPIESKKDHQKHRRRIKTEEKAKVVASVWGGGEEFIKFRAALDDLNYSMNCTRMI